MCQSCRHNRSRCERRTVCSHRIRIDGSNRPPILPLDGQNCMEPRPPIPAGKNRERQPRLRRPRTTPASPDTGSIFGASMFHGAQTPSYSDPIVNTARSTLVVNTRLSHPARARSGEFDSRRQGRTEGLYNLSAPLWCNTTSETDENTYCPRSPLPPTRASTTRTTQRCHRPTISRSRGSIGTVFSLRSREILQPSRCWSSMNRDDANKQSDRSGSHRECCLRLCVPASRKRRSKEGSCVSGICSSGSASFGRGSRNDIVNAQ